MSCIEEDAHTSVWSFCYLLCADSVVSAGSAGSAASARCSGRITASLQRYHSNVSGRRCIVDVHRLKAVVLPCLG
jgi:hypothetical protein